MLKQEYMFISRKQVRDMGEVFLLSQITYLGEEGWIFCGTSDYGTCIFRRPIDPNPEVEK